MRVLKNTFRALKNDPKSFTKIGSSAMDTYVDLSTALTSETKGLGTYSLLAASSIMLCRNIYTVLQEITQADKIVLNFNDNDDVTYDAITSWVSELTKVETSHEFEVTTTFNTGMDSLEVAFLPTDTKTVTIQLTDKLKAVVRFEQIPIMKGEKFTGRYDSLYTVLLDTQEEYEEFKRQLVRRVDNLLEDEDVNLRLYTNKTFGFSYNLLPYRNYESVILKEGQSERLDKFVDEFFEARDIYERKGFTHRTGILFYGPPGTGKTSIATALANKHKKNMYQIQLSKVQDDGELVDLFTEVPKNSVILLEDIDVAITEGKKRNTQVDKSASSTGIGHGITLGGLLNVLDGNFAPNGSIIIMTTNDKDSLDDALIRPGRADLHIEVSNLDDHQLKNMCEYYIGHIPEGLPTNIEHYSVSPSEVISVFRENVRNDVIAGKELVKRLKEKILVA